MGTTPVCEKVSRSSGTTGGLCRTVLPWPGRGSLRLLMPMLSGPVKKPWKSKRHDSPGVAAVAGAAASALQRCPKGVRVAADGDMDDFEDGNTQLTKLGGRDGYWWSKKDNFGSTVSLLPDDGGAGGSEVAMHTAGVTTSGAGGENWGAGIGVNLVSQGLLYDASKYAGI